MKTIFTKAIPQSINEKNYTLKVTMSVEVADRQGDIVDINSISLDNFLLNPVLLQYHNYGKHPVGKILTVTKELENGLNVLNAEVQFAVEEYEEAKIMFNLYKGGYLNAFSIGFNPGRREYNTETGITTLFDCELLELSCVAVPANQLALAKSKGLEVQALVDSMPKAELAQEIKDLMLGIKDILTTEKEVPKVEDQAGEVKAEVKVETKPEKEVLKAQILRNALQKAIRYL